MLGAVRWQGSVARSLPPRIAKDEKPLQGENPLGGVFQSWVLIPPLTLTQNSQFQAISHLQQEAGPGAVSQAISTTAFWLFCFHGLG